MTTEAITWMVLVQSLVAIVTGYLFYKVLSGEKSSQRSGNQSEMD